MKLHYPGSMQECLSMKTKYPDSLLLAGGTDINIQIKKNQKLPVHTIYINHLEELKFLDVIDNELVIGAAVSISGISNSKIVKKVCPYLAVSLFDFASPLIANLATLGGNIANASPTADTVPILLVLNANLKLQSKAGTRIVRICDFYKAYKVLNMEPDEIITEIRIPLMDISKYKAYYSKTGSRKLLSIAKTSLAFLKYKNKYHIAAGSLSPYPCILKNVENYLNSSECIANDNLMNALKKDVTPITDFRSDAEYRLQVCFNYIKEFYNLSGSN